jgi:phenylacetate-CoA ligase
MERYALGRSIKNQDFTDNILSQKIKEKWDIKLFSTYASTEMSTAFTECEFQMEDIIILS